MVNILGVIKEGPTNGRTGSTVRKEFHDYFSGLRVQLGAEERHLAADVRAGVLRDRDDRFDDFAVRYGEVRSGSVPAVAATGRPDDRGGHGDAEDGPGAETCVGADARPAEVRLDGSMLEPGRTPHCLFGFARSTSHRTAR